MGTEALQSAPSTTGRKRKGPSFPPAAGRKRRRTPAPAVQAGGWASLPTDITLLVAGRVLDGDVVDYISFRAVCSGWRACTDSPRDPTMMNPQLRSRAWVALCDGDAVRPDEAGEIAFFHTRTARSLRVRLPELRRYRIVGFTDGLVILLHKRTTAVRVLNPFTCVAVDLPPLAPVYHQVVRNRNSLLHMSAAVCTASPSSIAVVVWFPWTPGVLSTEPGRPGWEVIHKAMLLSNTLPSQGRLYGILTSSRQIVQVYPPNPLGPVVARVPARFGDPFLCSYYLVESGGHMLFVVRHGNVKCKNTEIWKRFAFAIFKVLDVSRPWQLVPVSNLGDRALFLCKNSDQSSERPTTFCQVHDTKERIRPSVRPFTIADHLLTYCSHREWARGLMFHEYHGVPECFEDLWKKIRKQDSKLRIPHVTC